MIKTPRELAEELLQLTHEYSLLSEKFAEYLTLEANYFHEHRHEHKSDTSVLKAWNRTEDGISQAVCKMKIKSHEKKMSAIRTVMRLQDTEARNIL